MPDTTEMTGADWGPGGNRDQIAKHDAERVKRSVTDRLAEAIWVGFQHPVRPRLGWNDVAKTEAHRHWSRLADDLIGLLPSVGLRIEVADD